MDRRSLRRLGIACAVGGGFAFVVLLCLGVALARSIKPVAQLTAEAGAAPTQSATSLTAETSTATVTATLLTPTAPITATDTPLPTDKPSPPPTLTNTSLPTDMLVPSPTSTGTLLSTDTPSPSPTPTSTPTPSPTPMTLVVRGASDRVMGDGDLHVFGEVENSTSGSISDVKVVGTFYNSSEQVLAISVVYTMLDIVGAGEAAPFDLVLLEPPASIYRYDLQVEYAITNSTPLRVEVINHQGSTSDGNYHVLGQVHNQNSFAVDLVRVVATFYNAQNQVIGAGISTTALDALSSGQTTAFDAVLADPPESVHHYALLVEAERK